MSSARHITQISGWRHLLYLALAATLFGTVELTGFRLAMWWDYRPNTPLPVEDLLRAFWMGARFDAKVMTNLTLLMLLAVTPLAIARHWQSLRSVTRRLTIGFLVLIFAFVSLVAVINHFYIDFYGNEINAIVFGLYEDDTHDIVVSAWNDYPILWLSLFWITLTAALVWGTFWAALQLDQRLANTRAVPRFTLACIGVVVLLLLARGTVTRFPLKDIHLVVAQDDFINMLVPNGPYALHLAYKARRADKIRGDALDGLERLGFDTPQEAAHAFGLPPLPDEALRAALYKTTPKSTLLEQRAPHVVFALMEAFGTHIMNFQAPGNDVLGRFARHADEDYLFRNFVAINHGTHPTLEGLLFNTPISPLSSSGHGFYTLSSSAVLPYKQAGYRTVFLSSGPANWRAMDGVLRRQGFDEVIDDTLLLQKYPDAKESTWGIPDEYMFRYALGLLAEADKKNTPLFLFMLSTSNHTPYDLPSSYQHGPLDLNAFSGIEIAEPDQFHNVLRAYQYAADALGGFLDELKALPLSSHTLVAATGDHSTRHFVDYTGSYEPMLEFGVPLYLYIPDAYQKNRRTDTSRFGGHRDIFPTLYHHSLSEACYLASGDNLLGDARSDASLAAYAHVMTPEGAVIHLDRPVFRDWEKPYDRLSATPLKSPTPTLTKVAERERAYVALLDWHIREQVLAQKAMTPPCAVKK